MCKEKGDSLSCVICLVVVAVVGGGIKSLLQHQWIIFQDPRFKIAIKQPHSKEAQARD